MSRNESLLNAMPAAQLAIRRRKRADTREPLGIVEWAEKNFLIAQEEEREGKLIYLEPHQKAILRYIFAHNFSTVIWSTPKKSGKTTVAAMVARWVAEEKGRFQEIYFVANDFEQAKSRAFNATMQSVALNPKYNVKRRRLEGQWAILDREMTHLPTGSKLKALATDYKGEAGAEPTLTVWCVPVETPILTADLRWLPAGELTIGQQLVGFEEKSSGFNLSRQFRTATITGFTKKSLPCMEIELDGDSSLRAIPEHQWLVRANGKNVMFWKRTVEIKTGDELAQIFQPWEIDGSYDAGYVAGAFDGEGHLSELNGKGSAGGYTLGLSQLPGKFLLEKVKATLVGAGFPVTQVHEQRSTTERLRIDQKWAVVQILGKYRPSRLLAKFSPDRLGHIRNCKWHKVKSVKDVGLAEMGCLSTDTKTYIARGYGAHNTELWGYTSENSQRFWTEMTPTPTRVLSMRWVETYAGFEGESLLLERLYRQGKEGRQLTANEIGDLSAFREAPNWDSLVPCWVNDNAGLFMYWDEGMIARRMPWQRGEQGDAYYRIQEHDLLPNQFERLHFNHWAASEGAAIPMEWWDACMDALTLPAGSNVPVLLGVDAGVSGDCTALTMVTRHPEKHDELVELMTLVWYPPQGGKMDYRENLTPAVDSLVQNHNVVQVAYDEYQLHHWANEQRSKEPSAWYRAFGQQAERLVADKQLYDLVRDRRLHHSGNPELRAHIQGCNAKIPGDEENRLRFVKRSEESKIDAAVALSMACAECLRLNL